MRSIVPVIITSCSWENPRPIALSSNTFFALIFIKIQYWLAWWYAMSDGCTPCYHTCPLCLYLYVCIVHYSYQLLFCRNGVLVLFEHLIVYSLGSLRSLIAFSPLTVGKWYLACYVFCLQFLKSRLFIQIKECKSWTKAKKVFHGQASGQTKCKSKQTKALCSVQDAYTSSKNLLFLKTYLSQFRSK